MTADDLRLIRTTTADIRWDPTESLVAIHNRPFHVTIEHAQENTAAIGQLVAGQPFALLINSTDVLFMDNGARKWYAQYTQQQGAYGVAIVAISTLSDANFALFHRVAHPKTPTRLFDTEAEARAWLHERIRGGRATP